MTVAIERFRAEPDGSEWAVTVGLEISFEVLADDQGIGGFTVHCFDTADEPIGTADVDGRFWEDLSSTDRSVTETDGVDIYTGTTTAETSLRMSEFPDLAGLTVDDPRLSAPGGEYIYLFGQLYLGTDVPDEAVTEAQFERIPHAEPRSDSPKLGGSVDRSPRVGEER